MIFFVAVGVAGIIMISSIASIIGGRRMGIAAFIGPVIVLGVGMIIVPQVFDDMNMMMFNQSFDEHEAVDDTTTEIVIDEEKINETIVYEEEEKPDIDDLSDLEDGW
jgi:hypothetical protein